MLTNEKQTELSDETTNPKKPETATEAIIELALFAPYNEAAVLIGTFSDGKEIPMVKGDDGYFRVKVSLKDGDYFYQFKVQSKRLVSGTKSMGDHY